MSSKNKIALGLMVFFVGFLMAACGSKNNTANTTNNNEIPKDFDDYNFECEDRCTRSYTGKFTIQDDNLYLQAFEHKTRTNDLFGDSFGGIILGEITTAIANPLLGGVRCGTDLLITSAIARMIRVDDYETDCRDEYFEEDYFGESFGGSSDLKSRYSAKVELVVDRNEVTDIRLTIATNYGGGGNDVETFEVTSDENVFENSDGSLFLGNSSGRLRLITASGKQIGYFQR